MDEARQRAICAQFGTHYCPPPAGTRVGIALKTLGKRPLNGMRVEPDGEVCGWYLWAGGEPSSEADFFQPLCVEHVEAQCPLAVPFLALPPGWRFLTDGECVDVWYDAALV